MKFYTTYHEERPVRLCEETRRFAYESLSEHRYGLDTKRMPCVSLDHIEGFETMTKLERYDAAIQTIAEQAPVRICEHERISGAATLGRAIDHLVPAAYKGEIQFGSVSHLTLDFKKVLDVGMDGIKEEVQKSLTKHTEPRKTAFLKSCLHCIDSFALWHKRYLDALKDRAGFEQTYQNLLTVPFQPASNFYEAVQSLWFTFAFVRLCGNWPGIGRIDVLLGKYLQNDLDAGLLTMDEAREILAHFFIKGCEWICGGNYGSGDAQHYQNIVLGGIDEDGADVTNPVTYLVLDIIEELGISDFPTTIRVNHNTNEKLLKRAAEVIRHGGGVVAVYNEDLVLDALVKADYSEKEARNFANDGCWEVQIPGKTFFSYIPFDALAILQKLTLKNYEIHEDISSFDQLYRQYLGDLNKQIETIFQNTQKQFFGDEASLNQDANWNPATPCTVVSLFEEGCIAKGLSYQEGGPVYNVVSPHIGGLPDVANSLYAVKKLVFDEKKISFLELMKVLKNDWDGYEPLRQYALNNYQYYGNDNDEVDLLAADLLAQFSEMCMKLNGRTPIKFPSGVSTFGRQIEWAPSRNSCPCGKRKGEILAGNLSPTPGTDNEGATAVIQSYCKADLTKQATGAALDIRLLPSCISGIDGVDAIVSLIRGFVTLGGFFMQIDIADPEILREAQKHPEDYQTLSVRVSGWNARFVTLSKEWQDMIINDISGGGL